MRLAGALRDFSFKSLFEGRLFIFIHTFTSEGQCVNEGSFSVYQPNARPSRKKNGKLPYSNRNLSWCLCADLVQATK